ncbi:MAG: ATP-dependent helicase, partial [Bacteroidales bacterium]|nr:ATP-dependent helicase [Bacteroidales bacterium]
LPPLSEQVYFCEMTEEQYEAYERYKSGIRNSLIDNLLDQDLQEHRMQVLEALLRLRQMSNHPVLVDNDYKGDSGKFNEMTRTIEALRAEGHKAIFFSSFAEHLKLISRYMQQQGYPHAMLTGQTRNRQEEVRKFQEVEDIKFFLISLKAGGTGLNLTAAGYVFILDPWWNPAAEEQALSRAHRIGQDKNVFVYRLISRGSIEEKIYKLQERKSKLAETFVNANDPFRNMSAGDIKELFR